MTCHKIQGGKGKILKNLIEFLQTAATSFYRWLVELLNPIIPVPILLLFLNMSKHLELLIKSYSSGGSSMKRTWKQRLEDGGNLTWHP